MAVLQFIDAISERTGRGVAYMLLPLTLVVFIEVVSRYIFNNPLIWSHETSIYLFGGIGMIAGAYVVRHNRNIRMDIFYRRWSPRQRAVVDMVTGLIFLAYFLFLIQATGKFAVDAVIANQHSSSPWAPPVYPMKIVMAIAVFLVLLQGSAQFIRDSLYAWRGKSHYEH